ncbi:hypothetical protein BDK51DRAFT_48959 [Blyttiomyces helicus]|uniref:Uncharacterized protein n=1 Tax=Blyttiomyces helicus TaxID=388810 RepID=A0A4P9WFN5_9FUNG|nr:hypothetical protein BDK51DRAFT_48959 [Blyttiomyces helicus]|eukprot:RKO91581.1 hypothetical protein BDK51DRAFT_48959 [Blyttiomyces helicus]
MGRGSDAGGELATGLAKQASVSERKRTMEGTMDQEGALRRARSDGPDGLASRLVPTASRRSADSRYAPIPHDPSFTRVLGALFDHPSVGRLLRGLRDPDRVSSHHSNTSLLSLLAFIHSPIMQFISSLIVAMLATAVVAVQQVPVSVFSDCPTSTALTSSRLTINLTDLPILQVVTVGPGEACASYNVSPKRFCPDTHFCLLHKEKPSTGGICTPNPQRVSGSSVSAVAVNADHPSLTPSSLPMRRSPPSDLQLNFPS